MLKDTSFQKKKSLRFRDSLFFIEKPVIMGILNITPDSFYDGGKYNDIDKAVNHIREMIADGATIIDVGAVSSRPNAEIFSANEEMKRLRPFLNIFSKEFPDTWFSIDTYNADTASMCVEEYGFYMINDISAYSIDKKMLDTVVRLNVPYVLMHIQGNPQTMQQNPQYEDVVNEVFQFLGAKKSELTSKGVSDIIIDPGFGFGKTIRHNFQLLKHLNDFRALECPVLAGISRKSMIYKLLHIKPTESINGTAVLSTIALWQGSDILRTHDVKETKEAIEIISYFQSV
jgi:dihydropteroate synthase